MPEHFHPQGKLPSEATIAAQTALRASLPFGDTRDFDEARVHAHEVARERGLAFVGPFERPLIALSLIHI